jgi:hypothetical protein
MTKNSTKRHRAVSRAEWLAAPKRFLRKGKERTRLRDQLSAERCDLPWVKLDNNYVFDVCARRRAAARHVQLPRPDAARPAGGCRDHELGPPPRQVRRRHHWRRDLPWFWGLTLCRVHDDRSAT